MKSDYRAFNKKQLAILEVAESLFIQKGYNAVAIKDIAVAAGINGAQVFYYFTTKEKLLEQMLAWRIEEMLDSVREVVHNEAVCTHDKLILLIERYIDQGFSKPLVLAQLFYENAVATQTNSSVLLRDFNEQSTLLIKSVLQTGQKQGTVKPSVDAMLVTGLIVGTITSMIINKDDYRDNLHLEHLDETAFRGELKHTLINYLKRILQSILIYE